MAQAASGLPSVPTHTPVDDAVVVGAGGHPGLGQGMAQAGFCQSLRPHCGAKRLLHKVTCDKGEGRGR